MKLRMEVGSDFVLKMLSAFYVRCTYSIALQSAVISGSKYYECVSKFVFKVQPTAKVIYLHFHCESLNEPLHLRCGSYLHEQIDLSHTLIHAI